MVMSRLEARQTALLVGFLIGLFIASFIGAIIGAIVLHFVVDKIQALIVVIKNRKPHLTGHK